MQSRIQFARLIIFGSAGSVIIIVNLFLSPPGQALCGTCRDETHRAKMFSQHDVIHMSKKSKDIHKRVSLPSLSQDNIEVTNIFQVFSKLVTHFIQVGTHAQKKRLGRGRRISIPVNTLNIPYIGWKPLFHVLNNSNHKECVSWMLSILTKISFKCFCHALKLWILLD